MNREIYHPEKIIDFHTHIASELFLPRAFNEGTADNMAVMMESKGLTPNKNKILRLQASTMQDHQCDQMVKEMEEAGVDEAVLLLPDFTYALPGGEMTIEDMIDHHRDVLARHPGKFRVFVGVDPRWGNDGLALFQRAIGDYSFHGLKLYPPCGYHASEKILFPYYELCREYRIPVLMHIGATSPVLSFHYAQPIYVDEAARNFPDVDFVLAHASVHYQDECAMLCTNRPNVYLDVSGYAMADVAIMRPLFTKGIAHKILFGTDWPIFRLQGKQKYVVNKLLGDSPAFPEGLSDSDKDLFFYKNAERLLGKRVLPS